MANELMSTKHLQIDKANATVVGFVAVAAFVVAFTLVASRALLDQRSYQANIIKKKTVALKQLKDNNAAVQQLKASYQAFESEPVNVIGGSATGTGEREGDNAKIVLDALPSKYDFPAMVTSIEKMLTGPGFLINSITGTDDEVNQLQQTANTGPIEMPFEASVTGTFASIQDLVSILQRSIRPIVISSLDMSGSDNSLTVNIKAKTYYQPEKKVNITTEEVTQ